MRKARYIVITVLIAFCFSFVFPGYSGAATNPPANELTIQQALERAYKNNPELRKAELNVEKADLIREDMAELVDFIPAGGLVKPQVQQVVNSYQLAEISWKTAKKAAKTTRDKITMDVVEAYARAIASYNEKEVTRYLLQEAHQQMKMRKVANHIGFIADFDYQKAETGTKQLEEKYNYQQAQYDAAIATLRSLLGENESWEPALTSRAILTNYERTDVGLEISRGLDQAVDVYRTEAELEMEKSQEKWIIPGISSDMQSVNTGLKETQYEQAKRNTRATIQQLYYAIDSLEGQIAAAEMAYDTARRDRELAEIKYEVGLIPYAAIRPDSDNLLSARTTEEKARMGIESLKATLADYKAKFAFFTGRPVYEDNDWSNGSEEGAANNQAG